MFSLRVISGTRKGQPLKAVSGHTTRPTTDKVKESIFNMIGPYFSEGVGLDLYAGSGSLGIEGLSRGLDKVIFVDYDKKAIQVIKENLQKTKLFDRGEVYRNDANRALKALVKRDIQFDVIFLDPPYEKQRILSEISYIDENNLLCDSGTIVAEHDSKVQLKEIIGTMKLVKREMYGDTTISIYKKIKE